MLFKLMANAKIKFDGREITLGHGVTTIGRASENAVAFPHDSNISRYHAEIRWRDDEFYLIDLGSSNGTTVNGTPVTGEQLLRDGDAIVFGGSSSVDFAIIEEKSEESSSAGSVSATDEAVEKEEAEIVEDAEKVDDKKPWMLGVAGAMCGLALVCVLGAAGYYYFYKTSGCSAKAAIIAPESGDLLKDATEVEVDAENTECVSRAVFVLDDMIIASTTDAPYEASIDPREFPELADGLNHSLKIVLEDEQGNRIGQPDEVLLAFETIATPTPTPEDVITTDERPRPTPQTAKQVSLIETQEMAKRLVKQFSGQFEYKFDRQFLQEVQKKTAEYASDGYFSRAQQYRDAINVAYVQEQNLDAPLGFVLAMSRSKFVPEKQNAGEGLWRMPNEFVTANAYNGTCEIKDLSEPTQTCAAISSAAYLKNIVLNVFEGDVVYGVAAFGMSPQEAAAWKMSLPANRADFWNLIRQPAQREEIVRFFAAGIVAENPQKFGLKRDLPISQLYRNLIEN